VSKDGVGALHPLRGVSSFMGAERDPSIFGDCGSVVMETDLLETS
jgi:hypothetical protein